MRPPAAVFLGFGEVDFYGGNAEEVRCALLDEVAVRSGDKTGAPEGEEAFGADTVGGDDERAVRDGVAYVLDLANCEVESSSSEDAGESSSSEATISSSSEKEEESSSSSSLNSVYDAVNNTLTDLRNRQVYKTVVIGIQVWMAQNLNYLPEDTVGTIWAGLSVCGGGRYKSKEGGNCDIYGRLYESDFTTKTENKRVICPDGWSVPTKGQYETMISYLGDRPIEKLVLNDGDLWPDIEGATNESGFSALPSGYYSKSLGYNYLESENTQTASFAIARRYSYEKNQIGFLSDRENIWYSQFEDGLYIAFRCIKD